MYLMTSYYHNLGPHTDEKQEESDFWRSSTVSNAVNGNYEVFMIKALEREKQAQIKTAADFNREQEEQKRKEEEEKAKMSEDRPKEPVVSI